MPGKHRRLSEQVFETVRRDIVSGALPPNTRLSEFDLSEMLGVSRTPVREALIKLAEDGLVRIVPQVGTFVAPISIRSVRESQFIREHLECAMIADAARRMNASTVQQLRDSLELQAQTAQQDDWDRFYSLDEAFHESLAAVSGHLETWRIVQQSKVHFDRVRHLSFRMSDHMTQLVRQHGKIVDALADNDAVLAEAALRVHLREVFGTLEKLGLSDEPEGSRPGAAAPHMKERAFRRFPVEMPS